jgi:hypothetical protein
LAVMTNAEAVFSEIAAQLLREPDVSEGTGFGSNAGLRVGGKIFTMLVRGELVVKLPAARCAELVATGSARPFDSGRGRPLREWVTVGDSMAGDWPALAREAQAFVRA